MTASQPSAIHAPATGPNWALFLDIDGTLLDIAPTPDSVEIPVDLALILTEASRALGGALAVASGRSLDEIDRLLSPLRPPCVGEHGAVIRHPDGTVERAGPEQIVPESWRARLRAATAAWGGVLVEEKIYSVAVHYRQAPAREDALRALVETVIAEDGENFELLPASMAFEIRRRSLTKALAVDTFMATAPFAGRIPVFVGDDVTDEDGFRAARAMGGLGLNVKQCFGGRPSEVRRWLQNFAASSAP